MFLPSLWCFMCCMFWFFFVANFSGAFCLNVVRICWGCCDLTIWIWGKCCVKVVYDFLVFYSFHFFISFLLLFYLFWVRFVQVFFPRASERRVLPIVGVCLSSSHLHIFTSSHLLIFTSSHFTSSHLHIFSSSHLLIFTSSHLHIFSSSHLDILTSSHLHIFTSSHLHIFSSSHLHILTSSHLLFLPSCPLALLPSPSFLFLFWRRGQGQCQRDGTKRNPFARNEVDVFVWVLIWPFYQ